ncbi:hypothetical protein BH23GEM4_BH23GEM4_07760 [soil metagenome]
MLQQMRGKAGKIVMVIVAIVFGLWGLMEALSRVDGTAVGSGELGRVDGAPITYQAWQTAYQEIYDQGRQNSGGEQLTAEQIREVEELTWNQLVNETLMQRELERRGIGVTDEEIQQAALYSPLPELMQQEIFQTDGRFDLQKYQRFISGPTANEQLLMQLEQYYRSVIPQSKLVRQLAAGAYVSDADLWQAWRDRQETATVEYVALDPARLVPGEVTVSAEEIEAYYEAHQDEFTRPAEARAAVAYLSKGTTTTDSARALRRVREVREELVGGADFAEVARRESADSASRDAGGELGTFGRGQMTPAFEEAAFSLPSGEISQPIQTPFGYHLIRVAEREGDQVTASHILIPFARSEEETDRLYARADSLEALAEEVGLERAARATGAQLRPEVTISGGAPFILGVGPALDGLEWVRDEWYGQEPEERPAISELFENTQSFYLVRPKGYTPAGTVPLTEATPRIRRELALQKKRERAAAIGARMVAEVRAGKPLATMARERGLAVETAGPFSRASRNPVFGGPNAAVGAAFGVPIGQVSEPVSTPAGAFLIRPVERTPADREAWEAQKESQRAAMEQQLQESLVRRWLADVRDRAKIVDQRDLVLRSG